MPRITKKSKKTVLVTGAAGFIGSHVVHALLARGYSVVCVDNLNEYYDLKLKKDRLAQFKKDVTFYKADIARRAALEKVFKEHRIDAICHLAAQAGVRDFVVPGNKPEKISKYKKHIESFGVAPVLYSPGLISQGGEISESAKAAGEKWHAIVGRAIYESKNMKKAAIEQCAQLLL